jgi:copper homeostasis protein (lipoprotein)
MNLPRSLLLFLLCLSAPATAQSPGGAVKPVLLNGMMTYVADAAVFEECVSATAFPIANEGDYLALETAYLADRADPGAPLFVELVGAIAPRAGMEGSSRETLIVDRFIRTRHGITCDRQRAAADLKNTYWRLDQLDGAAFPKDPALKEAHMVLHQDDTNRFRATLGCNQMQGSVTVDKDTLRFSAAASTMMACPAPLDRLEGQFARMLSEVVHFATVGETLVLSDATGAPRAVFSAIYF